MQNKIKNLSEFVKKIDQMKKQDKMDLSSDQDLSIAIMNLISIEEHFFFTAEKTGKDEYFDLLKEVREMRKSLLQKIIKEYEGEVWCISKHLLAASMRLMEVGTKQLGMGKKEEAKELFQKSYDLYGMFWALNMKLIGTNDIKEAGGVESEKTIKKIDENALNKLDNNPTGFTGKLRDLVRKAIDCCIE
ncbi:MAG TPA: hypothetical protein PLF30_04360 [Candidatus Moranbacteria bacterium]|jgi:hypothetical protein|nr:hypothetical protein [Candidatus Moranbacteria bacterium]HOF42562.1 hypothetical protein [Candidatus Moranbacteria bacterium]HPX94759.1 hypothetical protein [Candidatus Moranbacteria bacterium]HQB59601.1 hypothetical protein [Candidatus Moranbacteria bacterium]